MTVPENSLVERPIRWLSLILATVVAFPAHAAEPDFSTSSATFEPPLVVAGDIVRYTATIANAGADSTYTRIVTTLPHGYFIRADGDCAAAGLTGDRLAWHEGGFAAGTRKECRIDILTRPDAAGTIAALATEITTPPSGYLRIEASPTLSPQPDPSILQVGLLGITQAGLVTLALLAVAVIGATILARKTRRDGQRMGMLPGAWIAIVASIGFLLLFLSLARNDLRSYTDYRQTSCFIVGSAIRSFQGSGESSGSSTYAPEFAVQYDAFGAQTYGVASPPVTSVSFGSIGLSQQKVDRLAIGSSQPCWFDPKDVKTVLLERGPGAAYFFAVLPLITLVYGSWILIGTLRSRSSSEV